MFCSCGNKTSMIKYVNGIKKCNECLNDNLSGVWERNNEVERRHYAKEILQPGQPGFEEVYGKTKNTK